MNMRKKGGLGFNHLQHTINTLMAVKPRRIVLFKELVLDLSLNEAKSRIEH